jgi:AraC family transcriptional regulator
MSSTALNDPTRLIVASRTTAIAQSHLVNYFWAESFETTIVQDHHMVDLCLSPRPRGASAHFADVWAKNRFERIGGVFLLPAGFLAHARGGPGEQRSVVCRFTPEAVAAWLDTDQTWSDRHLSSSLDIGAPQVRLVMARLARELEQPGIASEIMVELLNMQVAIELSRFFNEIPTHVSGGLATWRLRVIDERVNDGGAPPRLKELAELVGLSVRQLTRGFRDSRGISIGAYVEEKRISEARRLLASGMSIKNIAFQLGFASPSAFSHAFRNATGETPRGFRAVRTATAKLKPQHQLRPDLDTLPRTRLTH